MLLAVGAALLRYFLPPGPTWFKIHEYCNSLNFLFTITAFALEVYVLEKYGRKHFYFKHASMVLAIFIIVVFQVLAEFNRPHLPPLPDPKREDEDMEGGKSNEGPSPSPGKSNIHIAWEIPTDFLAQYSWLALCSILMLGWYFMTGNTLNQMHYHWTGR